MKTRFVKGLLRSCVCVALVLSVASCSHDKVPANVTWDCTESNLKDTFDIQSLFRDRYILALEETEKSRIGIVAKVAIDDSLLFILDNRLAMRTFVFDINTGRFINSIGRTGNGPGEYVDVNDLSLNPVDSTVSLLCGRNRICVYGYDGTYRYQKKLGFFADKMEYQDGKYYFSCYDYGRGNLIVTDKDMHELVSYFVNKPDSPVLIQNHPLQKLSDGSIVFFRYLDDNIYTVDKDNNLSVHCQIDFGPDKMDYSLATKENINELESAHRCHIKFYTENDKYAWIVFYDRDDVHEAILDKSTGKSLAFPCDHIIDSAMGSYDTVIEYGFQGNMLMIVDSEDIKDELVCNKDCNRGNNPGVYFLINK